MEIQISDPIINKIVPKKQDAKKKIYEESRLVLVVYGTSCRLVV